jgi:hypothetical protein
MSVWSFSPETPQPHLALQVEEEDGRRHGEDLLTEKRKVVIRLPGHYAREKAVSEGVHVVSVADSVMPIVGCVAHQQGSAAS